MCQLTKSLKSQVVLRSPLLFFEEIFTHMDFTKRFFLWFETDKRKSLRPFFLPIVLTIVSPQLSFGFDWDPISPEEMAAMECPSDSTAGAEILLRRQMDIQSVNKRGSYFQFEKRVKLYDESVIEKFRTVEISYHANDWISDIHARVVKPYGNIIELKKKDIVRHANESALATKDYDSSKKYAILSFPNVGVGDIIDYRYRLTWEYGYFPAKLLIPLQEEWPIRKLEIKIRPLARSKNVSPFIRKDELGFNWFLYRCSKPLEFTSFGYYEIELENIEAYPDEPHQPPVPSSTAWMLFYKIRSEEIGNDYWNYEARLLHSIMESRAETDYNVKAKAVEITVGLESFSDKLKALYDFCRTEIINADHGERGELTEKDRATLSDETPATRVLSKGYGNSYNINILFCALAKAVGYESRLAIVENRDEIPMMKELEYAPAVLPNDLVAIKDKKRWVFYNPGARYLHFGDLQLANSGVAALIADKEEAIFSETQIADPSFPKVIQSGSYELDRNGTLTGRYSARMNGEFNTKFQQALDHLDEEERLEFLREIISESYPRATFRKIECKNVADPLNDVTFLYDLTIPNYAEVVGSRIFLHPNVTNKNDDREFSYPTRKTELNFHSRFQEINRISIKLPDGYAIEEVPTYKPIEVKRLLYYKLGLSIDREMNTLEFNRTFEIDGKKYTSEAYSAIKKVFDNIYEQDQFSITLNAIESTELPTLTRP